jgi:DNA-binding beta-propeller fold protein YncE
MAVNPNGTRVYAASSLHSSYYQYCRGLPSMIDTTTYAVIDAVDLAASPDIITVSPDGSAMYPTHTKEASRIAVSGIHTCSGIDPQRSAR